MLRLKRNKKWFLINIASIILIITLMLCMKLNDMEFFVTEFKSSVASKQTVSAAPQENCLLKEKRNFVYLRTHKTGSSTLTSIFRRYGYVRNLSFVLPLTNSNWAVGWPDQLHSNLYRPSKTGEYNIICEHAVLNISLFETIVPKDSVYITSVREPFSRFVSALYYFYIDQVQNISDKGNFVETFLKNPDYSDLTFRSIWTRMSNQNNSYPSLVRNNMAFDLGFRAGYPIGSEDWTYNTEATDEWLRELDKKMDLVMVTEYMDESLVLLRQLMCWSMKDILYETENANKRYKKNETSNYLQNVYLNWSDVDVKLYNHFLKKLKVKLAQQDESFWREVSQFKMVRKEVLSFCNNTRESKDVLSAVGSFADADGKGFEMTTAECKMLHSSMFSEIIKFYNTFLM